MTDTRAYQAVAGPVRAILYLRLSDLKAGDLDEHGKGKTFADREAKLREFADRLGWIVDRVVIENDVMANGGKHRNASAFKRRKKLMPDGTYVLRVWRPGFQSILNDFREGRANGLVAEDLDRSMRDPRDLEDLIDVAEEHKINARSLAGSLTFTDGGTDGEITLARVMVTMGNKASRDARRRQRGSRQRRAEAGKFGGGRRPFGFEPDGITVRQSEADVIVECSNRVLQIDDLTGKPQTSLRSLASELRGRVEVLPDGVIGPPRHLCPTVTGAPWSAEVLREILLRERNAGIQVYDGEEIGKAPWDPIVREETYRAVVRLLTNPSRNTSPGPAPKWLGSGIYLCGKCANGTTVEVTQGGRAPRYKCKEHAHLTRNKQHVDLKVANFLLNMLDREDVVDLLLPPRPEIDAAALRTEAKAIRTNLNGMARERVLGLLDPEQMREATQAGKKRLDEINELLKVEVAEVVDAPLRKLLEADDIFAAWKATALANQRAVIDSLVTVMIMPDGRRGPGFNPESVRVEPKERAQRAA